MRTLCFSWRRIGYTTFLFTLLAAGAACSSKSGVSSPVSAPAPEPYSAPPATPTSAAEPGQSYSQGTAAASPATPGGGTAMEASKGRASSAGGPMGGRDAPKKSERADADDRPGLATHWGETRASYVQTTSFERAEFSNPMTTVSLWYNDRLGAQAMAQSDSYLSIERVSASTASSGVSFTLQSETGGPLPGYTAGGRTYVIGEAGNRYVIALTNHTPARFEAVISVDGLDVLDGRPASYTKRGYIVPPYGSMAIDGFRQSESAVATFRFGSVRGSYAARKGDDRNIGVIGLALFHERGTSRWPWNPAEVERRRSAEPFPNRFASPPP